MQKLPLEHDSGVFVEACGLFLQMAIQGSDQAEVQKQMYDQEYYDLVHQNVSPAPVRKQCRNNDNMSHVKVVAKVSLPANSGISFCLAVLSVFCLANTLVVGVRRDGIWNT